MILRNKNHQSRTDSANSAQAKILYMIYYVDVLGTVYCHGCTKTKGSKLKNTWKAERYNCTFLNHSSNFIQHSQYIYTGAISEHSLIKHTSFTKCRIFHKGCNIIYIIHSSITRIYLHSFLKGSNSSTSFS